MTTASMFSVKEAARYLQINEKMIYSLIAKRNLPATKVTGKWLFSKHLIDQWLTVNTANVPRVGKEGGADAAVLILAGSNDILLDRLIAHYNGLSTGYFAAFANMGSMGGIQALQNGRADIATSHLMQDDEAEYNFAFLNQELSSPPVVVNFCRRQQGILLAPGNPKGIREIADLGRPGIAVVNRAVGTGTRLLFDHALTKAGIRPKGIAGYTATLPGHLDVGMEILMGRVDAGPGIEPVASLLGLDFLPLRWERYDFLIDKERFFHRNVQQFFSLMNDPDFRKMAASIAGYDLSGAGRMIFPKDSQET